MHHTFTPIHTHTQVPREGHGHFISYASRGRQCCGWIQSIVSYLIREAAHRHAHIKPLLACSQLLRGGMRVEIQSDAERWKRNLWILPLWKLVMLVRDAQTRSSHCHVFWAPVYGEMCGWQACVLLSIREYVWVSMYVAQKEHIKGQMLD